MLKFIATNKDKLTQIPVTEQERVIFSRDEQVIYLDSEGKRVAFKNILSIDKEENRPSTMAIEGCFYYVEDTDLIYRYKDGQWICLNSSEIIFDDRNSFPQTGDEKKIYVAEDSIYKWDKARNEYVKIGSGNVMGELYWGSMN